YTPSQAREEEATLLAECLSRDPVTANRSFEQLVRKHQEMVYALGYRFFGNHDDAAEIVQRTFIRVYQKLSSFRGASRFRTWLYQIALNLCRNFRRDEGRHTNRKTEITDHEEHLAMQEHQDPTEVQEERLMLRRAIDSLPPMQKSVVLLRVYDELPF